MPRRFRSSTDEEWNSVIDVSGGDLDVPNVAFDGERWRWIPSFEERYLVSSWGRVASVVTPVSGVAGNLDQARVLSSGMSQGYRCVSLSRRSGGPRNVFRVGRLVLHAFDSPPVDDLTQARHLNGVRHDDRLVNLRWGTPTDNQIDRFGYGATSLTREQVVEVFQSSEGAAVLAERLGVSSGFIAAIRRGRVWASVTEGLDAPAYRDDPRRVLTADRVADARRLVREGLVSVYELARVYGVTAATLGFAVNGTTWRKVAEPPVTGPLPHLNRGRILRSAP